MVFEVTKGTRLIEVEVQVVIEWETTNFSVTPSDPRFAENSYIYTCLTIHRYAAIFKRDNKCHKIPEWTRARYLNFVFTTSLVKECL
jgi:hypothetical protein